MSEYGAVAIGWEVHIYNHFLYAVSCEAILNVWFKGGVQKYEFIIFDLRQTMYEYNMGLYVLGFSVVMELNGGILMQYMYETQWMVILVLMIGFLFPVFFAIFSLDI